ncbi:MAG TPA: leucine--tRNA ligase [Patescibacteria group bacterium]|nr:leucine--tRNA ligase [Patescibacteria group bacterium]
MKNTAKKINRYLPEVIEKKWQQKWDKEQTYKFEFDSKKEQYYPLVELPYPSGDLHLGHWFTFAMADIHARVMRMLGRNVFFTNGFDAFGLPAENAAIKRGIHPRDWTLSNIATMKKQFATMGSMIDWSHETVTCLPEYYRWNQWIFLKMYEKGLAYRGRLLSNWCPKDMTVLANEHVENGKCWRCGTEVIQKEVEQWFLKITAYADRLYWKDKPEVDWPNSVRIAQNQWIGPKRGIEIYFDVVDSQERIAVFTTTPINFGATFLVVAPEHPFVKKILDRKLQVPKGTYQAIRDYVHQAEKNTQRERLENVKNKTGVFTGYYVKNHLTGENIPVWVTDYVLMNYGTGAVQGCPGHDERDFAFAKKFGLSIKRVVTGPHGETGSLVNPEQLIVGESRGKMVNSEFLDGIEFVEAMEKTMNYFVEKGWGRRVTTYHIRDWSISRQRYWGTPVPMIHCKQCGIVPVPEKDLPIELPYDVDFSPKGKAPLATATEWMITTCPRCEGEAKRDPETLDTFFDSSWYFYRYLDPLFADGPFPKEIVTKLMPLDIYFGGAEHTVGHTLYARFFTMFFHDLGLVNFKEFALRRVQHGVILGPDGNRMSKSRGNVVNPDDMVREFGADSVRLYLAFMMPYDATAPWNPRGMWGVFRLLKRVWEMQEKVKDDENNPSIHSQTQNDLKRTELREMHKTIKKVADDVISTKFNTAVSTIMKWVNYLESKEGVSNEEYKTLLLILSPFAPHITEELWQLNYGSDKGFISIHEYLWPRYDASALKEEQVTIVIQINGKTRDTLLVPMAQIDDKARIISQAKLHENVVKYFTGKQIKKEIYVRGKIINFVIQ